MDPIITSQLITAHESLNALLRPIGEIGTTDGIPLSAHPRFASVREELIRLGDNVGLVMKELGQQAEADMEHSPLLPNSAHIEGGCQEEGQ